ncbi:MAG: DUF502 domain-containing protein [Chloroflexi bacterium]|nr:DUF502 domain-containing protein [Chloroflexota bacterium]
MNGHHDSPQPQGDDDPQQENRTMRQRLESHIGRRIFSGFLVLVPLLATILILQFVLGYIDASFRAFAFVKDTPLDFRGIGVAFAVILFYSVGLLVAGRAGRRAIGWQNAILSKIPVVRSIFGVAQQATDALTSPSGHRYSRVVFLNWPRPGVLAMGFVTGHCHSPEGHGKTVLVVYIPTVPNPTSGMLAFVAEDEVFESNLSIEDAMKIVFSGGIVLPESMQIPSSASLPQPSGDS